MRDCCNSVERWASSHDFDYLFAGDELFARLPEALRERFADQPVVLADLARLEWLRETLAHGYARAIWCDADLLIFDDFVPNNDGDVFGRECWVQLDGKKLRSYRKIHNAWLQFQAGSSTLDFYIDRATRLLERVTPPVVPLFIGPKLLTAWHNIVAFDTEERVGMLSPLAMQGLLEGGSPALEMLIAGHEEPLCALNLSASCEGCNVDGVTHSAADYAMLVDGLSNGALSACLRRG
jgi:hypothetical protein